MTPAQLTALREAAQEMLEAQKKAEVAPWSVDFTHNRPVVRSASFCNYVAKCYTPDAAALIILARNTDLPARVLELVEELEAEANA